MSAPQRLSLTVPPGGVCTYIAWERSCRPLILPYHHRLDHRAQGVVGVATRVFHHPGIAGLENRGAPVAHADLHFAPQVENQASFWQRVEVHGPQLRKRMDPDLRALHQRAQLGVLCSLDFFHMAFAIRPGVDTVDAHTTPRCQCVVVRQPQTSRPGAAPRRRSR